MTSSSSGPGGVVHSYQGYDPKRFPSPSEPGGGGLANAAMEHMLRYGSTRRLTDEELANAIKLDPSQIAGLGPSLESMRALLEERRRKILATYDPKTAVREGEAAFAGRSSEIKPPKRFREDFDKAIRNEQLAELEHLWYRAEREDREFSREVLGLMNALGQLYECEELSANWAFTGREPLTVEDAIDVKEELETIEKLLKQLEEAEKDANLAVIDLDELREFVGEADIDQLKAFGKRIEEMMRDQAEREGLERNADGSYGLTPKAYKVFQGQLLDEIFGALEAGRSGRHEGPVQGEGVVELPRTRGYEFGDSVSHLDVSQSVVNAAARLAGEEGEKSGPLRMRPEDLDIHETRNTPKCATVVLMDMSGSMRQMGQYVDCKRMALGLDGLIRSEYPGDFLRFVEIYSLARVVPRAELSELLPKPVAMRDPVIRLRADLSDPDVSEEMLPPHFTNIQRGLQMARQLMAGQDTPNKQVFLITDGLPTAHLEAGTGKDEGKQFLYLLYPPDPLTERAKMREAMACNREGITINIFLMPSWNQSEDDIAFAQRLAEQTSGRVLFTGGSDLDRFVLWDYVSQRRRVIG
ncbi:MAG: hypothetical protein AAGB34_09710 [Planctomycetota bacterium]